MNEIKWNKNGGEVWEKDEEIYISETPESPVLTVKIDELDLLCHALEVLLQERDKYRDNWLENHQ